MQKALVLCSGGLDSVVCAHYVRKKLVPGEMELLFFDYGQRSLKAEKKAMILCANELGIAYRIVEITSIKELARSAITHKVKNRKIARKDLKNTKNESDKFYVPFRNTIFAAHALSYAESLAGKKKKKVSVFFGFKSEGSEHYSDTTQKYLSGLNMLIKKMDIENITVEAPLITFDKEDIIALGIGLQVSLDKTFSCYVSNGKHCGECLACALRKEGFYWAGKKDTTSYLKK